MAALGNSLLEPQVMIALITSITSIAGVLIAASKETKKSVTAPVPNGGEKPKDARATDSDRRVRKDDVMVIEAFSVWVDKQQQEISQLRAELLELRIEVTKLRRINVGVRQHNAVLMQQLKRAGEVPFPPPDLSDVDGSPN